MRKRAVAGGRPVQFAAALLAAGCALALAACAPRNPGAELRADPDLVVWTSHPEELVEAARSEFEDRTGLRLEVRRGGTGELLSLLRSGAEGRPDVFWGGGAESLSASADLFEPYRSPEAADIPEALRDPEWRWTGFSVLPTVLVYNARLVEPGREPRSWKALADPALRGLVAFADPRVSGSAFTALATIDAAMGAAFVDAFAANLDGQLRAESRAVFAAVASGECLVGASFENGALEALRFGTDLRFSYPDEGTSLVPDGIAMVAGTKRPNAARAFVDFALGPDLARVAAFRYGRRSARVDAPPPRGALPLESVKPIAYDIAATAAGREALIARFVAAVEGVGR
ncbi:MAG: extracellular solute-binding protein [Spirochaetales bacterium]|nr:extracellular solute-binding protein [Spirochaetales bacterium]